MTNANDARKAHELLDELDVLGELSQEQEKLLRSFLPDRPKDATLEDLLTRVHAAWLRANPSDWGFDTPAEHHDWLFDLRNDLVHIIEDQDTPATVPALPAGMRLAEHEDYGRVVAAPIADSDGERMIFCLDKTSLTGAGRCWAHEDSLTFIAAEPAKPTHPEFLETEADYNAAPEGTIVACDDSQPWHKFDSTWLSTVTCGSNSAESMSGIIREVLRWGWGK